MIYGSSLMRRIDHSGGRPPDSMKTPRGPPPFIKDFSPPEVNWREALNRMNREVRKVYSLPPVDNLLEKTPSVIKASLEIREKYFNRKNEDLINKARGLMKSQKSEEKTLQRTEIDIIQDSLCEFTEDLEIVALTQEIVSIAIMEEIVLHDIIVFVQKTLRDSIDPKQSLKGKKIVPSNKTKELNLKRSAKTQNKESFDWRSELKNRKKVVAPEEIKLGVPDYQPPFRSKVVLTDWRETLVSQMESSIENNPFTKWNKLDTSNSSKSQKLKPPKQREPKDHDDASSKEELFGARIKLKKPKTGDTLGAKAKVKKKTCKIINFVAISVLEEEENETPPKKENAKKQSDSSETKVLKDESPVPNNPICDEGGSEKHLDIRDQSPPSFPSSKPLLKADNPFSNLEEVVPNRMVEKSSSPLPFTPSETPNTLKESSKSFVCTMTDPSIISPVRQFKFTEDKRNYMVDSYFLGNLYVGPSKNAFHV